MRVPLGWLAEWIDLPDSTDALVERLTFAGLEFEGIERSGPDLAGIIVGHVLERRAHPDADRLSVCSVDLGEDEPVEIVCGAPNVDAGQRVAIARPGQRLPDGTKLKKSKIRGVVSQGMICSERELGLGEAHEGILVLDPAAEPGAPLESALSGGETVLDLEITPNRGDWASMLGIAREVRAHFGGEIRMPPTAVQESGAPAGEAVSLANDDPARCPSYVARVVRGVRPGPSPDWLCARLEAAGMRSVDVVVDVTNLVLLEYGQPLHAFDLGTLRGREIHVRRALADDKIVTLDGETRSLTPDDLVIADAERAVAIAGVMGGAETEVREQTRDILIESAEFAPGSVRRTARRLGLHSESSYRFERGIDPEGQARAADRAARLIVELAGGTVAPGRLVARGDATPRVDSVTLDPRHPARLLGVPVPPAEVASLLARVDVESSEGPDGRLVCRAPSYRTDITRPVDLVEEVARVYGYERIPSELPVAALAPVEMPDRSRLLDRTRDALAGCGLVEVRTFPAIARVDADALRLPADDPRRRAVAIENPIHEERPLLATTLLPSLFRVANQNLARQAEEVCVFEVGRVFLRSDDALPHEPPRLAALMCAAQGRSLWRSSPPPLLFELKGVVERLAQELGAALRFVEQPLEPFLHPGAALGVLHGKRPIGGLGELHPEVAAAFGIEVPCAVVELDLEPLLGRRPTAPALAEVSDQPAARRDCAVLVDATTAAGEILAAVRKAAGRDLVSVELFDRYEGSGIPDGKVSLAFRMVFQRADRTLRDAEVQQATDKVREMLVRRFQGELR